MTTWPKNLYFDLSPLEFLSLIFNTSSSKPKAPRDNDTKISVHTYIFLNLPTKEC